MAADWWTALNSIKFTRRTAVVLMTHSLEDDVEILTTLRERPAAYLGVLGPAHRRQWLLERIDDAEQSDWIRQRLRGPIGLDLGDRSPAGIAVSVVSEILSELNGRTPAPLSDRTSNDALDGHSADVKSDNRPAVCQAP